LIPESPVAGFVLGAGVTGLSAGIASGFPVLEAADQPGGICTSYYLREGRRERLTERPASDDAYQFENGGGHWIFGGDDSTLRFISSFGPLSRYERRACVFFPNDGLTVPFPLQNHLSALDADAEAHMRRETAREREIRTLQDWLEASFGETLCRRFFFPFHELYTAGLYRQVAPQDAYKSPREASGLGYNNQFLYPQGGLSRLVGAMAQRCDLRCGNGLVVIDRATRTLAMADGARLPYSTALSTLPLQQTLALAGIAIDEPTDPWTSVLVLNVAALRGPKCPHAHWVYLPDTSAGFHRVGFYSHVDESFLPQAERGKGRVVSLYIERAFIGGDRPSPRTVAEYTAAAIAELRRWGFIEDALIVDPTWIDVAYTWGWPGSQWRTAAIEALEAEGIFPVGRYARWIFQGIAESIRDGLAAGARVSGGKSRSAADL
jgi:protoporphyrinogen oxidase